MNVGLLVGLIAIGVVGAVFIPLAFDPAGVGGIDFIECAENEIIKTQFFNGTLTWVCTIDSGETETGISVGTFANENTEFRPHVVRGTNVADPVKDFGEYSIRVLEYLPNIFGETSWDYLVPQDYELGEDLEFTVYWFKEDGLADGSIVDSYNEESTACQSTTTTAVPLIVSDGIEYDFVNGEEYLILVNTAWGNDQSHEGTSVIDVRHGSTVFEGSRQQHVVHTASPLPCSVDEPLYKYFWWTLWKPNATEALEDISLNIDNTDNQNFSTLGAILYDDTTISIIKLSDHFVENIDYFSNVNNADSDILNSWATGNSATITFTPNQNNDDWLVLGSNLNNGTTATYSYETRLLTSGSQSDILPFISRQGEAQTTSVGGVDAFENDLHSFARVFSLENATSNIIPNPIINYELNGTATDDLGGTDLQLSDGGTGLSATGWNFLAIDQAQIIANEIPDTEYAIEMVFSFDSVANWSRILDYHNFEGGWANGNSQTGIYASAGSTTFWNLGLSGGTLPANTLTHVLIQRDSLGFFEMYQDGALIITFDDNVGQLGQEEATFRGNATNQFTPQPATFFKDDDGEEENGFVDCIRIFDTALTTASANTLTANSSTCFPFPTPQSPTPLATTFTVQTQVEDGEINPDGDQPVPDQRLSNSIFALNLDKFTEHAFVWSPNAFELDQNDFDQQIDTITISTTTDDKQILVIADVGIEESEPNLRTQLDNADVLPDETFQSYNWETDLGVQDVGRWTLTTMSDPVLSGNHTIDIDGGNSGGKGSQFVDQRSLIAVLMQAEPITLSTETVCMEVRLMSVDVGEDLSSSIVPTHTDWKEVCATTSGGADILRTFVFNYNSTENPFESEEVGIVQLKRHSDNSTNDDYTGKVFTLFGELQWIVTP